MNESITTEPRQMTAQELEQFVGRMVRPYPALGQQDGPDVAAELVGVETDHLGTFAKLLPEGQEPDNPICYCLRGWLFEISVEPRP